MLANSCRVTVFMVRFVGLRLCFVGPKVPADGQLAGSVQFESSVSVSRSSFSDSDGDVVVCDVCWHLSRQGYLVEYVGFCPR